jgi:hypothetical protein
MGVEPESTFHETNLYDPVVFRAAHDSTNAVRKWFETAQKS